MRTVLLRTNQKDACPFCPVPSARVQQVSSSRGGRAARAHTGGLSGHTPTWSPVTGQVPGGLSGLWAGVNA